MIKDSVIFTNLLSWDDDPDWVVRRYPFTDVGGANATFTDGVTTSASPTLTSATAAFVANDAGKSITGTNIPPGTTILSVQSATSVTLSQNATASGSALSFTIVGRGGILAASMKPGYLVKFDATAANVLGALGADDAVLSGVIVDLPDNTDTPTAGNAKTMAVAFEGSFDKNQIKYADGSSPISVAGVTRLRGLAIFLDPATPAGPWAP